MSLERPVEILTDPLLCGSFVTSYQEEEHIGFIWTRRWVHGVRVTRMVRLNIRRCV